MQIYKEEAEALNLQRMEEYERKKQIFLPEFKMLAALKKAEKGQYEDDEDYNPDELRDDTESDDDHNDLMIR